MQEHAPALSVLLVVRREQAWLEEAAASVLADETVAVELVAVDDGADDHAPELLDDLARRDARVRVEHLPEPLGPAATRERAVALARAPYVWFLRPTDLVAPGALARIVARVGETDPDVLFVHHVRRGVLGAERPGPARRALKRIAADGAELLDDPGAASRLGPSLGAQVVRRAHVAAFAAPSAGRGGD